MMAQQWLLLAIIVQLADLTSGGAVVQLYFQSFTNAAEKDWDDKYCELFGWGKCDHKFIFCLDETAGSVNEFSSQYCRIGRHETSHYPNKNSIQFGTNMNGVHNPTHDVTASWKGSCRLKVRVMDDDDNADDLVDKLYTILSRARPYRSEAEAKWLRPNRDVVKGTRGHNPTSLLLDWTVYCEEDYFGADCATYCKAQDGTLGHYTCDPDTGDKICRLGYESPRENCIIKSDDCHLHKCENSARCIDGNRTYTCDCPTGYTGQYCQIDIDECQSNPCLNGATCVNEVGNYTCQCAQDYLGRNCGSHVCDVGISKCLNGATCYDGGKCMCPDRYAGSLCDVDKCDLLQHCNEHGFCSGGRCQCDAGYYGNDCSFDVCLIISCAHGGTCDKGACKCRLGYYGDRCQDEFNECSSNPCKNEGTCKDELNSFYCRCLPAYTGFLCETHMRPDLNETLPEETPVVDIDVTAAPVVDPNVDPDVDATTDDDDKGLPAWALGFMIVLGFLILVIILVVALLLKYRRRLSKAKREAADAQEVVAGIGNFANPLYNPQTQAQVSGNYNAACVEGAEGPDPQDDHHIYANAAPLALKLPLPEDEAKARAGAKENPYDTPCKQPADSAQHADTPPAYTPPANGVFASVLQGQAGPLPDKSSPY